MKCLYEMFSKFAMKTFLVFKWVIVVRFSVSHKAGFFVEIPELSCVTHT